MDAATCATPTKLAILGPLDHVQGTIWEPSQRGKPETYTSPFSISLSPQEVKLPLVPTEEEKQEEGHEEEAFPTLRFSSTSPDEEIMPPPPASADDFRHFQDLFHRMADSL